MTPTTATMTTTSSEVVVPLKPVPASRPRVARNGGVFYTKTYAQYIRDLEKFLKTLVREPLTGLIHCDLQFVIPRFKTVERPYPRQDLDNLTKAIWDAMTKCEKFWADDSQVVSMTASKRFVDEDEEPHTLIYLKELPNA